MVFDVRVTIDYSYFVLDLDPPTDRDTSTLRWIVKSYKIFRLVTVGLVLNLGLLFSLDKPSQ